MSNSNGVAPGDLIARVAAELREGIAAEQVSRLEHERAVAESRERERRLQRTLNALEGDTPGRPAKSQAKPVPKPWTVGDARVADVLAAARDLSGQRDGQPFTSGELTKFMGPGISGETIRRALSALREREQIRLAGGSPQRGGTTARYALMPEGHDGA